jgi:hypothetical protein
MQIFMIPLYGNYALRTVIVQAANVDQALRTVKHAHIDEDNFMQYSLGTPVNLTEEAAKHGGLAILAETSHSE